MKNKVFTSLALLSLICLTGCSETSSISESSSNSETSVEEPVSSVTSQEEEVSQETSSTAYTAEDITLERVLSSVSNALSSDIQSYSYGNGMYYRNTSTGDVSINYSNVMDLSVYEDESVGGTFADYTPAKPSDYTAETKDSYGKVSAYEADDEHYIYAYTYENDASQSYAYYFEKSPWYNSISDIFDYCDSYIEEVYDILSDPEENWPEATGYVHNDLAVEEEDGEFVATYSVSLAENDESSRGEIYSALEITLDKDDLSVTSTNNYSIYYDYGAETQDLDSTAYYYFYDRVSNIEYGDPLAGSAEQADLSSFNSSNILGSKPSTYSTVELDDGDLTESEVIEVMNNINAYADSAVETSFSTVTEIYDNGVSAGYMDVSGTVNRYQDYIWIYNESGVSRDTAYSYQNYTKYIQRVGTETGITRTDQTLDYQGEVTYSNTSTLNRYYLSSSVASYFRASVLSVSDNMESLIYGVSNYGFGTYSESDYSYTIELVSASRSSDDMSIVINYSSQLSDETTSMKYELTFEDDFLSKLVETDGNGIVSTYNSVSGTIPEFTGSLL